MDNFANRSLECVIRAEHLAKSFGKIKAVVDFSFEVKRGEIFGLLGPNGAGKTTILGILEGLYQADSGYAHVLGMDIAKDMKSIKHQIGVQLQNTSLLPDLTVYEQIQLFGKLYGGKPGRDEIETLLSQVGLSNKTSVFPDKLSGGQRQRLSLALALVNQPEIVFLDEPTTGLDPQSRRALWDLIRSLRDQDKTVVLTTHYMEEAESLCDRIGIIDHGKLVALDTPGALINSLAGLSSITTSAFLPLDDIRSQPFISNVQRDGAHLHMQTCDVAATLQTILNLAEQNNLGLNDLQIKQPNLEDVFLKLTGHTIRN